MRRYSCPVCSNEVHFDNQVCVNCGSALGYDPQTDQMLATHRADQVWSSGTERFRACGNRPLIGCNWLVPDLGAQSYCLSCQHTHLIPDLSARENIERWTRLERAKRAVFYSLFKFHLPVTDNSHPWDNPLVFEFKADVITQNGWKEPIVTGHANGLITINIAEADDVVRERQRKQMGEPYRTLAGHFRHEIGHYYWDRLVANTSHLGDFRDTFGNECVNYANAVQWHYQSGAPAGWEQSFVSAYASSHPWEDFAETWAHYFHIVDGLETAASYQLLLGESGQRVHESAYDERNLKKLIDEWVPLTIAMNAMNRSIGNSDFYPFVMSDRIFTKLQFVHRLIHQGEYERTL